MNGAVLAGPARVIDGLFHVRRMFGGALWSAWPFAAVARHYADGFLDRFAAAVRVSEDFARALRDPFRVERIPGGSHLFYLRAAGVDFARLRERLAADGIHAPEPHRAGESAGAAARRERNAGTAQRVARWPRRFTARRGNVGQIREDKHEDEHGRR